jgi:amino acid transporter
VLKRLKRWGERGAISGNLVSVIVIAAIALIVVGIGIAIGGPTMLTGFETMRTDASIGNYTGLTSIVTAGPTLLILGFLVAVAVVGFLGIKMAGKKGD